MDSSGLKKVALVILIIAVLLGIIGLGVAFYYYRNTLLPTSETETTEKFCGCYSVIDSATCSTDSAVNYAVKVSNNSSATCTSLCSSETAPVDYYVCRALAKNPDSSCPVCPDNSEAEVENGSCVCCTTADLKVCTGDDITGTPFCQNIVITDSEGKKLAPPYDSQTSLKVTAYFKKDIVDDLDYTKFKLKVNNKTVEIDGACDDSCTEDSTYYMPFIEVTAQDLESADTLNITATSENNSSRSPSTNACTRSYDLFKAGQAYCPNVITNTSDTSVLPVSFTGLEVPVINLPTTEQVSDIKMKFTFTGIQGLESLTTNSLKDRYNSATQKITLDSGYLNNASNFVEVSAFPTVNFPANSTASYIDVKVTATVIYTVSGQDQATELPCGYDKIRITRDITEPTSSQDDTGDNSDDGSSDDSTSNGSSAQPDESSANNAGVATSRFSVLKDGPYCVERVSPNNVANFTITITNADTDAEMLRNIRDKLPLGFSYVANSSAINGVAFPDSSGVTVDVTGDTHFVIWSIGTGWTLSPDETMTIQFMAIAGNNAITGNNDNEVVIEPNSAPYDPTGIRAVHTFTVEQTCSAPRTGLFDSTYGIVSLGILTLIMGVLFYYTSTGHKISQNVAYSKTVKNAGKIADNTSKNIKDIIEDVKLKLIYPRDYFEKKIIRNAEKGRKKEK